MQIDENIALIICYLIFIATNIQSLHLDHGSFILNVHRSRDIKVVLKMELVKFKNDCKHIFNPSFVNNIVIFRCYVGEQSINDGMYHNHKLLFNEIEPSTTSIVNGKSSDYQMINMAYEPPIEAIERRRGSSVGWSWIGAEDGRLFIHKGILYVVFTAPSTLVQESIMRSMFIMKLKDAMSGKYTAKEITNKVGYQRKTEKHWAFISNEETGQINVLYQLEPFTLGILDEKYTMLPVYVQEYSCLQSQGHVNLNIATNVIRIRLKKDLLVLIFHAKGAQYNPHILFLDTLFPYLPIMVSRDPLEVKSSSKEDFIYLMSLSTERGSLEANKDDTLIIGGGLSDRSAAFAKLTVPELFSIDYIMCTNDE